MSQLTEAQNRARAKRLKDNYNLTPEEYALIEKFQNGVCFICGKKNDSGIRLSVDHRHRDGLVRGLLCQRCNRVLGKIEDPRWKWGILELMMLIKYLTAPPAVQALGREVFGYAGKVGTKKQRKHLAKQKRIELKRASKR